MNGNSTWILKYRETTTRRAFEGDPATPVSGQKIKGGTSEPKSYAIRGTTRLFVTPESSKGAAWRKEKKNNTRGKREKRETMVRQFLYAVRRREG